MQPSVQGRGEQSQKTSKHQKGCLPQQPPSNGLKDPLPQVSFELVSRPRNLFMKVRKGLSGKVVEVPVATGRCFKNCCSSV